MDIRLRRNVSVTRTEYGAVLLDERSGEYWQLNPTGTVIAEGLLAGRGRDLIAAELVAAYEVGERQAADDVDALVDQLGAADLIAV